MRAHGSMEQEVGDRSSRVKQADVLVSRVAAMALLFLVGGCATTSSTQGSVRLGVVDSQKVLNETDAGKKAKGSLNSFMKNSQALIELEEKELKRKEGVFIKQASVNSANAYITRNEQLA